MFSAKFFDRLKFWGKNLAYKQVRQENVVQVLELLENGSPLGSEERWTLLNIQDEWVEEHQRLIDLCKQRATDRLAFAMSPLYASNLCYENCTYCGDRRTNVEQVRIRLKEEQLRRECSYLVNEQGMNNVELVYATDKKKTPEAIARDVELTLEEIHQDHTSGGVWTNADWMSRKGYRTLKQAGCTGIILWQECYDPSLFRFHHHPGTPKSDQRARLDVYDRAIQEGLEVGIAVLSGLAPWQFEWWILLEHIEYLRREYGFTPSIIGTPRLTHADLEADEYNKKLSALFRPTDLQFQRAISIARLSFPEIHPWHQTREPWEYSIQLMATTPGCVATYLCSTSPGGYTLAQELGLGPQFKIYSTPFEQAKEDLSKLGLELMREWKVVNHRIQRL